MYIYSWNLGIYKPNQPKMLILIELLNRHYNLFYNQLCLSESLKYFMEVDISTAFIKYRTSQVDVGFVIFWSILILIHENMFLYVNLCPF